MPIQERGIPLGFQQERPDWERRLPEYAKAQLDYERSRPRTANDVMAALERLEARLIRIEIALGCLPELKEAQKEGD